MLNVIVLDDDLTNVQLLQMLLELDGFSVIACTDIEQAVKAANQTTNAFVVDWHLERNASGLELLQAVRQGKIDVAPNTIMIMSSGDYRRQKEAMDAGADYFLLKPYPPDELSKILIKLLRDGGR